MKQLFAIGLSVITLGFFTINNINTDSVYGDLEVDKVTVDIVGALENRGLFEVDRGDSVLDILNDSKYEIKLTMYADKYLIKNPFDLVEDGMEILIPYKKGYEPSEPIPCIDNLTVDILTKHGITSNNLAIDLVDFIKKKGMIRVYEELLEVKGMGNVRLGNLSEFSELC